MAVLLYEQLLKDIVIVKFFKIEIANIWWDAASSYKLLIAK